MKKNLILILDPAHGVDVSGKCSPDGRHYEFLWSRKRVQSIKGLLTKLGYEVYLTTESEKEPGLYKRKNFASQIRKGETKLLLSFHNNAAGSSNRWMTARGVEVYTTPGITDSDICAEYILGQLKSDFPKIKFRYNRDSRLDRDKEAKFTVLMGSGYMGVLIEWLFQDNMEDVKLLTSPIVNREFEASIVKAVELINDHFKS